MENFYLDIFNHLSKEDALSYIEQKYGIETRKEVEKLLFTPHKK